MALFLRRNLQWSKLTFMVVALIFLQLVVYYRKKSPNEAGYTKLYIMKNTSSDYQFIRTSFPDASEGSWQYVSDAADTENKFLAFSAFLDNRFRDKFVSIISVAKLKKKFRRDVWCKFWYQDTNEYGRNYTVASVPAEYKIISEHWGLAYTPYYVRCPITNGLTAPSAVSLVTNRLENSKNLFKLIVNLEKPAEWSLFDQPPTFKNMAVCVKPLHYEYNEVMELLQFIELHRIMGVDHFYFYNHTVGSQVNCLLNNYINEGLVTMLPWNLPVISQKEIRTEGIFAALNDCLYRTMHVYTHAMFVDMDEYIVLKKNQTYMEFFKYLNSQPLIQTQAAFLFQNAFFYRQWPDDSEVTQFNDPLAENLLVLKKTRRRKVLHKHRTRSKYIVRPELINMVGNHFVWEYADKKFKPKNISPDDGILHHYRVCEFGGDDCVTQESVVDRTVYKYKDELVRAVRYRVEKHRTECQLNSFLYN